MNRMWKDPSPAIQSLAVDPASVASTTHDVLAAGKSLRYTRNQATPAGVALSGRRSSASGASTVRFRYRASCDWGWADV